MAQDSWPNMTHNSRNVTDDEYEQIAARFSDDGVYGDPTSSPVVTSGSGLQVLIKAGHRASLRGHHWYSGGVDDPLTIAPNSSGQPRVDAVVLRLDRSDWTVRAAVRQGTPAGGMPALVRDTGSVGMFEILLATVSVANGATTVIVTNRPQFVGSRIRTENQGAANPNPALGEIAYRPNTGEYRGYVGTGTYVTLYSDSGDVSLPVGFADAWEPTGPMVGRKMGSVVSVQINLKRKEETFQDDDPDGSHLATVPTALRPRQTEYFAVYFTNDTPARAEVRTDGEIWVTHPQNDVPINHILRATFTWLKPS